MGIVAQLVMGLLLVVPGAVAGSGGFEIKSMRAFAFHHGPGILGTTDLFGPRVLLWNTPFNAGGIQPAASITLVLVGLVGKPPDKGTVGTLEINARAGERKILEQVVDLRLFFNPEGQFVVPFLVYGTGCEPLALTATWRGPNDRSSVLKQEIPFSCGE